MAAAVVGAEFATRAIVPLVEVLSLVLVVEEWVPGTEVLELMAVPGANMLLVVAVLEGQVKAMKALKGLVIFLDVVTEVAAAQGSKGPLVE